MTFIQNCKYNLKILFQTRLIHIFLYISSLIFIIGQIISSLKLQNYPIFKEYSSLLFLLIIIIQNLIFISAILIFKKQDKLIECLGINRFNILKSAKYIISGFLFYFSITFLITYFNLNIPGFGEQQDYLQYFGKDKYSIIISVISVAIVAPIIEELFFRGFIFNSLQKVYSQNTTNLIASLIFACIHLQFNVIIPLFILGYIIGYIRIKTNSVIPCIIFHIINNSLALFAQYSMLQ
jgi:membrane protease YdiL (CAAX protease family)